MHKINHANIKDWARDYDGPQFDAILCDPPYELGFMGKSWDSSGIAFDKDMWADLLRILKPGGHLLAFSGSRTYHRMACAIEDAGFEIRDMIEWVYGSGFPKSLNISKALDKQAGEQRNRVKVPEAARDSVDYGKYNGEIDDDNPITEEATYWNGYGTALKPAHEPCVLARKPLEGTVANNALKYGTGGLNIDGTRIEAEPSLAKNWDRVQSTKQGIASTGINAIDLRDRVPTGRFPANLIHDGSDEVVGLFPDTKSGAMNTTSKGFGNSKIFNDGKEISLVQQADSGSAARFFYTAKSSKSERNAGLEGFEEQIRVRQVLAGEHKDTASSNFHPTVKPLTLTKYLATLIKPPTGGRLLVPFSGSGSEMIGALQAGWDYVEGVELTEEYIPIAEARIKYWTNISHTSSKPKTSAKKSEDIQTNQQELLQI
jgi:DNA modification methylase